MAVRFEWDPAKAEANWQKHKVTFEQAQAAFKDPHGLDEVDDKGDYGEERLNLTGMADDRLIVVTYNASMPEPEVTSCG